MKPRVAIVMPVYNAEATLAEAVESILAQTMEEYELLVALDCCTDGSPEIARAFADDRVKVCALPSELGAGTRPAGVSAVAALAMARGSAPLVARMDADDVARPERLSLQCALLDEDPSLAAVSGQVRLIEPQGDGMQRYVDWVNGLATPEDIVRERFVECPVIQPSMMIRRSAYFEAGGYRPVRWAEDHDLFLRMLEMGMKFGKVGEVVLDWRDSATRLTRTHPDYAEDQVWKMKAHHLGRISEVRERGVAISGAGPIGKRLANLLRAEGTAVHGFFEVHPRRIGQKIGGVPVAGPDEFGTRWREAVLLSAVGLEGGRERVRALAAGAGYREGEDFWCCC